MLNKSWKWLGKEAFFEKICDQASLIPYWISLSGPSSLPPVEIRIQCVSAFPFLGTLTELWAKWREISTAAPFTSIGANTLTEVVMRCCWQAKRRSRSTVPLVYFLHWAQEARKFACLRKTVSRGMNYDCSRSAHRIRHARLRDWLDMNFVLPLSITIQCLQRNVGSGSLYTRLLNTV